MELALHRRPRPSPPSPSRGDLAPATDDAERCPPRLLRLVVRFQDRGRWTLALDPRHPAFDALCAVLRELSGCPGAVTRLPHTLPPAAVEPLYALGHQGRVAFRVLLAGEPVDVETLRRRLTDVWPASVTDNVELLVRDGVLTRRRGGDLYLAPGLPTALPRFVLQTAEAFAALEPRLAERRSDRGSQLAAFVAADDGAPRLFGTDVRLRNLMALAKHGPLLRRELRRITGTGHLHVEGRDEAPFDRGALVRVWKTDLGPAVMLDRDHPLHLPFAACWSPSSAPTRCRLTSRATRRPRPRRGARGRVTGTPCSAESSRPRS
jgi:hypothetical protein